MTISSDKYVKARLFAHIVGRKKITFGKKSCTMRLSRNSLHLDIYKKDFTSVLKMFSKKCSRRLSKAYITKLQALDQIWAFTTSFRDFMYTIRYKLTYVYNQLGGKLWKAAKSLHNSDKLRKINQVGQIKKNARVMKFGSSRRLLICSDNLRKISEVNRIRKILSSWIEAFPVSS